MSDSAPTVAELARRFALDLRGDGAARMHGVAGLQAAGPDQL